MDEGALGRRGVSRSPYQRKAGDANRNANAAVTIAFSWPALKRPAARRPRSQRRSSASKSMSRGAPRRASPRRRRASSESPPTRRPVDRTRAAAGRLRLGEAREADRAQSPGNRREAERGSIWRCSVRTCEAGGRRGASSRQPSHSERPTRRSGRAASPSVALRLACDELHPCEPLHALAGGRYLRDHDRAGEPCGREAAP